MAFCFKHNQTYDENNGGYCIYCGKPNVESKTITTSDESSSFGTIKLNDGKELLNENC